MTEGATAVTVDLFEAALDLDPQVLALLEATLSPEERSRARARPDELERRRFIVDHGWRRRLLAQRLGYSPEEVVFELGEHGKPRPAGGGASFSASRAAGTALYAVADGTPVGVDVEAVDPARDLRSLARRTLSGAERARWEALPEGERPAAFYACWTRKEAHGKALGTGMVFPLSSIDAWRGDDGPLRVGEVVVRGLALAAEGLAGAIAAQVAPDREVRLPSVPQPLTL